MRKNRDIIFNSTFSLFITCHHSINQCMQMFPALLYTHWTLSAFFCDAWIFFDQTVCTASILNLCMISLDRYWVITKPQEYLPQRTPLRMLFYVSIAWIGAFIVALPPVLFSDNVHANEKGEPVCLVSQKITYQIYATLITFYIPYGIMLCVYSKIFRARRCIARETMRRTTIEGPIQTDSNTSNLPPHQKKLRFKLARKFQASNIIGILVAAFTLCWAPFFVLALVRPFFNQSDVPDVITFSFLWLGYMNSLLNPIINMTLLHEFREPISKLLCCKWSELNLMRRKSTASERNSNYLVVKIDWL